MVEAGEVPSLVMGPLRGVMVRCSRGRCGAGDILPEWWRDRPRGGEVPGVGEVDLKMQIYHKISIWTF